jgi:putative ABC transport system ATP-binding protein
MLKVKNLTKKFQSGDVSVKAVNNINLEIPKGFFATIIGKSGSGKSTLLSLLGALDKPTSGEIIVDDEDITKLGDRKLIKYRRDKIGFIFQNYNLVPNLSALENVMLPMEFAHVNPTDRKNRAEKLLQSVGLTKDKFLRKPARLSGGEQQRVAIARALANKPKLILADEPTGNLDSATGKIIVDLLKSLAQSENTTIIAVTHDNAIAKQSKITFKLIDGRLEK